MAHGHRFRRPADGGRQPPRLRPPPERRSPPHRPRPRRTGPPDRVPEAVLHGHARNRVFDPHQRAAAASGDRLAAGLRLLGARSRPLPCQRLLPARLPRRGLQADPLRAELDRRPRPAGGGTRDGPSASRLRARHRPDRVGQVHLAGGHDRRDQHHPRGAHPHDRGPDRVPARAQEVHRQPARAGRRRAELRHGPEGGPAPGPRRDPGRRDARPRDDQHGPDSGRDRPPGVRHAPHPGHRPDHRPHHRRVPLLPAGPGARAAVGGAAGHHDPAADPDLRRVRSGGRVRGARPHPGRSAT